MNTISTERLAELIVWLDRKWARHHEEEDLEAAEALRELLHLRAQCESRDTAALVRTLTDVLALDSPWPLRDVFTKMLEAADHLLKVHDCDTHGHEEFQTALICGRALLLRIDAAIGVHASAMKEGMVGKV